jgi:DNA-binding MarR family transcriptional regulator
VLRILRGAGEEGLTAGDMGDRMITRDPDVTRLLDRLEKRGLAERWRCTEDRRVVWTRITPAGLAAIAPLDEAINEIHLRRLGHLGPERLSSLIELLEAALMLDGIAFCRGRAWSLALHIQKLQAIASDQCHVGIVGVLPHQPSYGGDVIAIAEHLGRGLFSGREGVVVREVAGAAHVFTHGNDSPGFILLPHGDFPEGIGGRVRPRRLRCIDERLTTVIAGDAKQAGILHPVS